MSRSLVREGGRERLPEDYPRADPFFAAGDGFGGGRVLGPLLGEDPESSVGPKAFQAVA
jgi:hypothetical protein